MQVYLPVHQATCREEILDRIDPFGFDNQTVIRYIKHFDDSGRADVTFRYACIKAVAAKIIKSVHIQLTAYELMQKAFRVFVLEDLNGKTQLAVHLFIHLFHQHERNLFVRDSFYNRVFQYMRERAVSYIMQQDGSLHGLRFTIKDKIAFGGQLGDSFTHQVKST